MATDDILFTVDQLRKNGVDFLHVPDNYYETVLDRVGQIDENLEDLTRASNLRGELRQEQCCCLGISRSGRTSG